MDANGRVNVDVARFVGEAVDHLLVMDGVGERAAQAEPELGRRSAGEDKLLQGGGGEHQGEEIDVEAHKNSGASNPAALKTCRSSVRVFRVLPLTPFNQ